MRATQLADRYAAALRTAIGDTTRLEAAAQALNVMSAAYQSHQQVRFALANPVLPLDTRRAILDSAMKAYPAPEEVVRLLRMMLEENRMTLLPTIASRFEVHIDDWLERVEVTVITAVPLTDSLEKALVGSLEKFSRKTVRLNAVVDPKIIGGLIVLMWGVFFDFSLRTRLERLKQKLLAEEMLTYGH
jgi:F-type H+-transporting ATPase subunit delta